MLHSVKSVVAIKCASGLSVLWVKYWKANLLGITP